MLKRAAVCLLLPICMVLLIVDVAAMGVQYVITGECRDLAFVQVIDWANV